MGKRPRAPPTVASEEAVDCTGSGSASEDDVAEVSPSGFPKRPTRPQGSKAAKSNLLAQKKSEKILQVQARATETMAEASHRKANSLQDQCAMSLFTMPDQDAMSDEDKKYFALHRQEEIYRLERCMQAEKRRAEVEELEHAKLLKERNLEKIAKKKTSAGAPASRAAPAGSPAPAVTAAPPTAPSPTAVDTAAAEAENEDNSEWEDTECVPETPVEAGESQPDATFGGSDSLGFVVPSQVRNFRGAFSSEMPHPDYVCSPGNSFGQTNSMYGGHRAVVSPNQGGFTGNHMNCYRNGGQGFNLNAQFYLK